MPDRKHREIQSPSKTFGGNQHMVKDTSMGARSNNRRKKFPEGCAGKGNSVVVGCKAGFSSRLFSSVCSTSPKPAKGGHMRYAFGNLSCTSAPDVHLPTSATSVVRASANWDTKASSRKSRKPKRSSDPIAVSFKGSEGNPERGSQVRTHPIFQKASSRKQIAPVVDDMGCSGGLPLATERILDCKVPKGYDRTSKKRQRRPFLNEETGIMDLQIASDSTERPSSIQPGESSENASDIAAHFTSRRTGHPHEIESVARNRRPEVSRRPSASAGEQLFMLEASFVVGGMDTYDQHSEWRLDVDSMTYEDLLELGDRIGYVNTGLTEETIKCCLRKTSAPLFQNETCFQMELERKCSICQDEYEANDELGKLYCGHSYHAECIKQWLLQKNLCPICKASASS
eukprot:TRINITY_DN21131_c0_g1_i1.p1 TRINITY_DN21131_c0_g1~~TRINITY_DN21131_c0_g1_i1.p1  ORF type:complete len:400 (-),score=60.20 TRINITY_DN21131_c0_g1_i1:685-1884(-)